MSAKMKQYWCNDYPYEVLEMLLERNGRKFKNFEFMIECESDSGQAFMMRPVAFRDADEMRLNIADFFKKRNLLIKALHIGPCWTGVPRKVAKVDDPKTHDLDRLRPDSGPLKIDIDLTDYAQLGVPKENLEANDLHWPILNLAIDVSKRLLKEAFGLEEVVCFYSGRRGVHIWVMDERAWQMDDEERATVLEFMSCPLDKAGVAKDSFLDRSPWYKTVYEEHVLETFGDLLLNSEIDLFKSTEAVCRFEAMMRVRNETITNCFRDLKTCTDSPVEKFRTLSDQVTELATKKANSFGWMKVRVQAAILTLLWPRFDKGASTKLGHMIKAPFSVHSSTQRIAVPLPDDLSNFWPGDVPRLGCEADKLYHAEGILRDKLKALGKPKPFIDPLEEWYMNWSPPSKDPVLEQVEAYEEWDRRFKRRKKGIDDKISAMEYTFHRPMWAVQIQREHLTTCSGGVVYMQTVFHPIEGQGGSVRKVPVGKTFRWESMPVDAVWKNVEKLHAQYNEKDQDEEQVHWDKVRTGLDTMLLLFEADGTYSKASKDRAVQRLNAILQLGRERAETVFMEEGIGILYNRSKYLFWLEAFKEIVNMWPVPGLVTL